MKSTLKRSAVAAALVALCAPAYAHDERQSPLPPIFGGIVQERDVGLVFDYLRDAVGAAIEGREAAPPDEITRRAEAMGEEMKRRGAAAARALIDVIEKSVRDRVREPAPRSALPPAPSSQRI